MYLQGIKVHIDHQIKTTLIFTLKKQAKNSTFINLFYMDQHFLNVCVHYRDLQHSDTITMIALDQLAGSDNALQ